MSHLDRPFGLSGVTHEGKGAAVVVSVDTSGMRTNGNIYPVEGFSDPWKDSGLNTRETVAGFAVRDAATRNHQRPDLTMVAYKTGADSNERHRKSGFYP